MIDGTEKPKICKTHSASFILCFHKLIIMSIFIFYFNYTDVNLDYKCPNFGKVQKK